MIDFFLKGGILMWPILLCSIAVLAIVLERLFHFRRARVKITDLVKRVEGLVVKGEFDKAEKICAGSPVLGADESFNLGLAVKVMDISKQAGAGGMVISAGMEEILCKKNEEDIGR